MTSGIQSQNLVPAELGRLGADELLVNEFFTSIQGESSHAGRPCFFIRLTGCHLRCTYCDTEYAFFEGFRETVRGCVDRAREAGRELVEVTGGEPLLQRATPRLLSALCDAGHTVLLETSGAVGLRTVDSRVRAIVDVKCPSSGMADRCVEDLPGNLRAGDELKFVIANGRDFDFAREWLEANREHCPPEIPIHFSPIHGRLHPEELARRVLESGLDVRVNLQLHKYIWPDCERGV